MAAALGGDRKLASEVRRLALNKIKAILEGKNNSYSTEFQNQLLLRLAGSVLPRLNEHTGEDGGSISISFDPVFNDSARIPKAGRPRKKSV